VGKDGLLGLDEISVYLQYPLRFSVDRYHFVILGRSSSEAPSRSPWDPCRSVRCERGGTERRNASFSFWTAASPLRHGMAP